MDTHNTFNFLPLSDRIKGILAPGTSSMRIKATALKDQGIHVVNFAAGELSFDACSDMKVGASRAVENQCNRYTPPIGLPQLRKALAEVTSKRCNTNYTQAEVAVTAGAKQALFNTALILLNPGDEVIIPTPYWETFPTQVRLAEAIPVFVNTAEDNFQLTFEAIERATTARTKMIVINTPNNPTGAVYTKNALEKIAHMAYQRNIWIVFDECYRDFIRANHTHYNIVELFEPIKRQTILINSFSKSHAVTGWRAGYACGPSHVIAAMHNLQGHTTSNASSLAQYAALHTLANGSEEFKDGVNKFLETQLEIARSYLDAIEGVSYAPPEGAFYLYLNVSKKFGGQFHGQTIGDVDAMVELLLTEVNIAVVPGSGSGDPNSIRITYCLESEEMKLGMERLTKFMGQIV